MVPPGICSHSCHHPAHSFLVNYFFAILPFRGINAFVTMAMATRSITTKNNGLSCRTMGPGPLMAAVRSNSTTTPTALSSSSSSSSTSPPTMPPRLYLTKGLPAVHKPLTWTSKEVLSGNDRHRPLARCGLRGGGVGRTATHPWPPSCARRCSGGE